MAAETNSIIRVKKKDRYAALANSMLRDERLTFEARGLLSFLLSMPDDWEVRFSHLLRQSPAKRTALRRIIKECISFGYMRRERVKAAGGRFEWVTEVYEEPRVGSGVAAREAAPWVENRPMENLSVEDLPVEDRSVENLSIYKNCNDERPTDERLRETKTKTTTAAARVEAQAAPPSPSPSEKIFIPIPFPVSEEMRAFAAAECPRVNLDDATDKFVIKYSPEAVDDPPAYTWSLWVTKWKTWMRREQKFELRDGLPTNGDAPPPKGKPDYALTGAERGDFGACPDCNGQGFWYPEGYAKGVVKCRHERMPRENVRHVSEAEEVVNV